MKLKETLLLTARILLAFIKSFFKAVTELAWGLAGIFLLLGLLVYFEQDISIISPILLNLFIIIQDNTKWFLYGIFLFYFVDYLMEIFKK